MAYKNKKKEKEHVKVLHSKMRATKHRKKKQKLNDDLIKGIFPPRFDD
jgi:hypothetical protein